VRCSSHVRLSNGITQPVHEEWLLIVMKPSDVFWMACHLVRKSSTSGIWRINFIPVDISDIYMYLNVVCECFMNIKIFLW